MTNKDLIAQYVDTGLKLPEYQINKLSNNDNKTYFRKRIISIRNYQELSDYEYQLMSYDFKLRYITKIINLSFGLSEEQYNITPDNLKLIYLTSQIKSRNTLRPIEYDDLPPHLKLKYLVLVDRLKVLAG